MSSRYRSVPLGIRQPLSIRPAVPPRAGAIPPDDSLCTWVWRITSTEGNGTGYWELKYIHAGCLQHSHLPRAA